MEQKTDATYTQGPSPVYAQPPPPGYPPAGYPQQGGYPAPPASTYPAPTSYPAPAGYAPGTPVQGYPAPAPQGQQVVVIQQPAVVFGRFGDVYVHGSLAFHDF